MDIINNSLSIIASRDIIERVKELEEILKKEYENEDSPLTFEEYIDCLHFEDDTLEAEYKHLFYVTEQCKDCVDDWEYGIPLIHEDYFTDYIKELLVDCGDIPEDLPWYINDNINWDGIAADCMCDYTEVDFDGVTYYVR